MKRDSTANMARRTRGKTQGDLDAARAANASGGGMVRPSGAGAVMASRQRTPPDALDYYPTPPWAGRAGGELIARLDPGARTFWEPACGEGHLAHGLADHFPGGGFLSDIWPYGCEGAQVFDFLGREAQAQAGRWDWIVTNPPFIGGALFARAAWPLARRGVALLLRLQWLEGGERSGLLYSGETALCASAVFSGRVPMKKGRWDPQGATATAYAWFFWLKPAALAASPARAAIEACRGQGGYLGLNIGADAQARLHRDQDLARFFAVGEAGPLFGGEDG